MRLFHEVPRRLEGDSAMVEVTDSSGMVSGGKIDTSKRFETFYGRLKTAPMIKVPVQP